MQNVIDEMEMYVSIHHCTNQTWITTSAGLRRTGADVPSDQRDIAGLLQAVVDTSKGLSAKEATVKYGKGCGELPPVHVQYTDDSVRVYCVVCIHVDKKAILCSVCVFI